jgi:hypothetical protein
MSASVSQADRDAVEMRAKAATRSTTAIVSEGVLAGFIAASAVALVFLAIDLAAGEAFRTPRQLGALLLAILGGSETAATDGTTALALYTLFHFLAFAVAGIVAAAIVQMSMKSPVVILLFVILFFAFEVLFTGLVALLDIASVSTITPLQVALGNVVASVAMALFFRVRHPRLRSIGRAIEAQEDGDR